MYKSKEKYPFLQVLEDNWKDIRDEYLAVATNPDMHAWPENKIYDGGWDTYGLWGFGIKRKKNCERCPKTTKALEQIPGLAMAGFSRLAPGTHIKPHVGYGKWAQYVLRCHLGLIVPEGCEMRVGPETRKWEEGKVTVFCDATEHEVWNRAATPRVVLLFDFRNPEARRRLFLNPQLTADMEQYIKDHWKEMSFAEKAGFITWRIANLGRKRRTYVDEHKEMKESLVNAGAAEH